MILVDTNVQDAALSNLPAIPVFGSIFGSSMKEAYPQTAVAIHLFCGLHTTQNDPWYGPTGLVRSLVLQLLANLDTIDPEMESWSLGFIDDREFLGRLERHSLRDLCRALHSLLNEFKQETYVYCIVDSISYSV